MKVRKFEALNVWIKSQDLAVDVYRDFKDIKDFGFNDQIKRAVISISNNIAEGFDRSSAADFSRFLYFAIASCSEVRSMLYIAERLEYISQELRIKRCAQSDEIAKMITGLIKYLKTCKNATNNYFPNGGIFPLLKS